MNGQKVIQVDLIGNPNSGKSTLFNGLTGSCQQVGNYPGVTVERVEGRRKYREYEICFLDLPGTYNLLPWSEEETISCRTLLDSPPDLVMNVINSSNLERNLYMTIQLLEWNYPIILLFNMSDIVLQNGEQIDVDDLSRKLGVPIIQTTGTALRNHQNTCSSNGTCCHGSGQSIITEKMTEFPIVCSCPKNFYLRYCSSSTNNPVIDDIMKKIVEVVLSDRATPLKLSRNIFRLDYGNELEVLLSSLEDRLTEGQNAGDSGNVRFRALRLLEGDTSFIPVDHQEDIKTFLEQTDREWSVAHSCNLPTAIAAVRYQYISELVTEFVHKTKSLNLDLKSVKKQKASEFSNRLDKILTHRFWGIPIFLFLMYVVFQLTFTLGQYPMEWIEKGFGILSNWILCFFPNGKESLPASFLVDGIIGGVGGVLVFLPNIVLLFVGISILEDSGYMTRVALLMNRFLRKIGLPGNSFIPMIIGFGCSVPAIMATRTLESRKDRLTTMFIIPLMSCGARLPIYTMILPAFFPMTWTAPLLWAIYMVGIILAVILGKLLRGTVFSGDNTPLILELPYYHCPNLRSVCLQVYRRAWCYLHKAGTVILAISIILWFLMKFPQIPGDQMQMFELQRIAAANSNSADQERQMIQIDQEEKEAALEYSFIGHIGHFIEPILRPMGFDWKIGTSLIGAFAAKEVFVAQMAIVYKVGESEEDTSSLREALVRNYSPLVGLCIILFTLVGMPCMATFAVIAREAGGWRYACAQWLLVTLMAWLLTTFVFQTVSILES